MMVLTLLLLGKILFKSSSQHASRRLTFVSSPPAGIAVIFAQSILLSSSIVDVTMGDSLRGELACLIAAPTCSFCNNDDGQQECPQWTEADVKTVLSSQLKSSAALGKILFKKSSI